MKIKVYDLISWHGDHLGTYQATNRTAALAMHQQDGGDMEDVKEVVEVKP